MNRFSVFLWLGAALIYVACGTENSGRWASVQEAPFEIVVPANGELASSKSSFVGCPVVSGMWEFTLAFMAPEGKEVEQGQLVIAFDDRHLRDKCQLKKAELATQKKELEKVAHSNEHTLEKLKLAAAEAEMLAQKAQRKSDQSQGFSGKIELEKLRLDNELAKEKLTRARSRIDMHRIESSARVSRIQTTIDRLSSEIQFLEKEIASLQVKAPKRGMVVYISDWNGEKPKTGDAVWIGRKIVEVPDLTKMEVKTLIAERDAGKVEVGQEARITLDANKDRVFRGRVQTLGRLFHIKSWRQPYMVFDAVVSIDNPDEKLMRPGMKAKVDIVIDKHEKTKQIPFDAIEYSDDGAYVTLSGRFGRLRKVGVELGERSADMVCIENGLEVGAKVLVP